VLGHLRGWNNDLGARYIVVWEEDHFEEVTDISIAINDSADRINQLNDDLGRVVSWSCLTSNHDDTWHELGRTLMLRSVFDRQVAENHVQDVQQLAFVLMNSLDLNVVQGVEGDLDSSLFEHPLLELRLVGTLDFKEFTHEFSVFSLIIELSKSIQVGDPLVD